MFVKIWAVFVPLFVTLFWATIASGAGPTPVPVTEDTSQRLISGPYTDVDGVTYRTPTTVRVSLDWVSSGATEWCAIFSTVSPTPTPGTCTQVAALTSCGLCAAGARKNLNCAANADCQSSTDTTSTCTISSGVCMVTTLPFSEFRLLDRGPAKPQARLSSLHCWTDSNNVQQCAKSWIDIVVERSSSDVLHQP